jgi:hypothetical protein
MGIAVGVVAHRPAASPSFACPAGDKALTPRRLARADSLAAVQSSGPGSPGPPRFEPSTPSLGRPNALPENVYGAVRAPLLDGEQRLVPKARALSHYSGKPSWKRADYSNRNRGPDRMSIYGPELRKKPRRDPGFYPPQAPGNSHCAPTPSLRSFRRKTWPVKQRA